MSKTASYSISWALEIYEKFRKSYPRATKIFQNITNHEPDYPAWLIAMKPEKWNRYKKIIHFIEKIDEGANYPTPVKQYYQEMEEMLELEGLYPKYEVDGKSTTS